MIQAKIFAAQSDKGVMFGAGGYISGDGALPAGFSADAFMKRFSSKIIRSAMLGDEQAQKTLTDKIAQELALQCSREDVAQKLDAAADNACDGIAASIDAAPLQTVETEDVTGALDDLVERITIYKRSDISRYDDLNDSFYDEDDYYNDRYVDAADDDDEDDGEDEDEDD